MFTIYSDTHRLHHGHELKNAQIKPSVETPSRVEIVLNQIQALHLGEVITPRHYDTTCYSKVHSPRYLYFLEHAWAEWTATGRSQDALPLVWPVRDLRHDREPNTIEGKLGFYAMDAGVPITAGTWEAVRASANLALTGVDILSEGKPSAFALCRPPGHHAATEYMGGYCYLNNTAIAAQAFIDKGARRVAVLDVDYHHGNGTQTIFYERSDVLFISLHGNPTNSYPYFLGYQDECGAQAGLGFNHNYPLPHGTTWAEYQLALTAACQQISDYSPEALVISLGVDTFEQDPISHFKLKTHDYLHMGKIIATVEKPTLFVMEGGYQVEAMGHNVVNVLRGFEDNL